MKSTQPQVTLWGKTFERSIPYDTILNAVDDLACRINRDYGVGQPIAETDKRGLPIFVGVLNGAFMFMAELLKRIEFPCEVSFVKMSSYDGLASTGRVQELIGLKEDIAGRRVIVVEDIVETGGCIERLVGSLTVSHPASIEIATMLFKPGTYTKSFPIKYRAIELPDDFIVGFGLDYNGLGRNLKDIYKHIVDEQ